MARKTVSASRGFDSSKPPSRTCSFSALRLATRAFTDPNLPVWADHRGKFRYGIPGSDRRGFKIADDTRGPDFDPTNGERVIDPETLKDIREYVAFRFPALRDAPLIETRVCQYEQTPDGHFIIDRHPTNENVWLLGGGSGHGFKHGPAIGEMMADLILGDREPEAIWKLRSISTNELYHEGSRSGSFRQTCSPLRHLCW